MKNLNEFFATNENWLALDARWLSVREGITVMSLNNIIAWILFVYACDSSHIASEIIFMLTWDVSLLSTINLMTFPLVPICALHCSIKLNSSSTFELRCSFIKTALNLHDFFFSFTFQWRKAEQWVQHRVKIADSQPIVDQLMWRYPSRGRTVSRWESHLLVS